MTTRLLLIRHGATVLSAEDRFAGATDVALSEEGQNQARALGERLARLELAAVYASPMQRTVTTATFVAAPHQLNLATDPGLREIDHGHWEQLTRREVEQRFPEEYANWEADPFTFAPEGGESGLSVMARALPAIRRIVVANTGKTVAVVSHKATIRLVLCGLLGIDPRGYRDRLDQSPACLNVLDFKDAVRARLVVYNDTSHYTAHPAESHSRLSNWWG
ncbi:MAG: histidine phosphatase family protein [Polyangiaceae bacterium]